MAGIKYEKDGHMVQAPKGHKMEGWGQYVTIKGKNWGLPLRGAK
jgi:hypothetical protein